MSAYLAHLNDNEKLDRLIEDMRNAQRRTQASTASIVRNIEKATKRTDRVKPNDDEQPNEDN